MTGWRYGLSGVLLLGSLVFLILTPHKSWGLGAVIAAVIIMRLLLVPLKGNPPR